MLFVAGGFQCLRSVFAKANNISSAEVDALIDNVANASSEGNSEGVADNTGNVELSRYANLLHIISKSVQTTVEKHSVTTKTSERLCTADRTDVSASLLNSAMQRAEHASVAVPRSDEKHSTTTRTGERISTADGTDVSASLLNSAIQRTEHASVAVPRSDLIERRPQVVEQASQQA